jgi:hypothetical protein
MMLTQNNQAIYLETHNNIYESRKVKTTYNLIWWDQIICKNRTNTVVGGFELALLHSSWSLPLIRTIVC